MVARWLVLGGAAVLAVACGGSVGELDADGGDAAAGEGGVGGTGVTGGTGGTGGGGTGGTGGTGGSGGSGLRDAGRDAIVDSAYEEPPCPDAQPPEPQLECDPFATPTGCDRGYGCYLFVIPPAGRCDQETYGTFCQPGGTATQGESCLQEQCAAGFECVITGVGTQCVQLCPLTGDDGCPPGLVCEPIDVEGFGGCF